MRAPVLTLRAALPAGFALIERDTVDSTMEEARRWLGDGKSPEALVIAALQTAGRGRRGRDWSSPTGNLYATLLVPHPGDWRAAGRLGFVISLAIAEAIGPQAQVKWPNDVLIGGAKVAGILLEAVDDALLIGFGVNLVTAPAGTPYPVTTLAAHGLTIAPQDFAAQVVATYFRLQALAWPQLQAAWLQRALGIGQPIIVTLPDSRVEGIFAGLNDDGALRLLTNTGEQLIHAGDVFFPNPERAEPGLLWQLTCVCDAADGEALEYRLADIILAATQEPLADGRTQLALILSAPPAPDLLAGFAPACAVAPLPRQDWLALGARGAAGTVGPFTLVTADQPHDQVLTIALDGKHAFGDGHHATTQGCLRALGHLHDGGFTPRAAGDIGCGTGVLSIAAAKLWPGLKVMASDLHLPAVATTRAGVALNTVADAVTVFEADGFDGHADRYDLICMNILLRPIMVLADEAVGRLAPGGALVLSGILDEQAEAVRIVYSELGLLAPVQSSQDGWMTLTFRKPA